MNKFLRHTLLLLFIALALNAQSSDSVYDGEWLMFSRFLNHTGYSDSGGPLTPEFVWSHATGAQIGYSSPAVSSGMIFIGSTDHRLYAFNSSLGSEIWNYTTDDEVWSSPAFADGMVYFGSDDYQVYALNASNGAKVWNYSTGSKVRVSPAVYAGVVYVGSYDADFYALNASNGSKIWSYPTGGSIWSDPAIAYGLVYFGSDDQYLYALNVSNGSKVWDYDFGGQLYSTPAVSNGMVYIGSSASNMVYALNASTGQQIANYTTTAGGTMVNAPAIAYGKVYIGCDDKRIYALNASNVSQQIWNYSTHAAVQSAPAVSKDVVYFTSMDSRIYALNASTGAHIWNYSTGSSTVSSPALADGVLYVGSYDGRLYAIGPGEFFWEGDLFGQLNVSQTCGSEINATALNFGSLVPGQTSGQQSLLLTNIGSWNTSDITLEGTDWISTPTVNFTANYTKWSNVTGFAYASGSSMTNTPASMNFNLTNNQTKTTYFRVQIPLGQATATYTQNITLTTIC